MPEVEYRIGGLDIDPKKLTHTGINPYDAAHKFIVGAEGNIASIYVAQQKRHAYVAEVFGFGKFSRRLDELVLNEGKQIVGGDSCYLDRDNNLVLDDYSGDFYAIPEIAAQKFAELIKTELEKKGVIVKGLRVDPERVTNIYWDKVGVVS